MITRTSTLTQIKVIVIEIEPEDEGPFIKLLDQRGHGFAFRPGGQPAVVLDGRIRREPWFTEDHMIAVEAHEVCHILLSSTDEMETDSAAIMMLELQGLNAAAQLLRDRVEK